MKNSAITLAVLLLAGCSSMRTDTSAGATSTVQRAERNLCEVMRSYEPYNPNECTVQPARTQASTHG